MKLFKHFDFTRITEFDRSIFNVEVGEKWHNNELQQYVDDKEHLYFDDGLVINATFDGEVYKSARINTKDKMFFKYGKFEFIAKVPEGVGTWPAIWMMPQFAKYGAWPKSGEIDIMEHVGRDKDKLFLCLHTEKHNHHNESQYYQEYRQEGLSKEFQKFGFLWEDGVITYLLNDEIVAIYKRGEEGFDPSHKGWPFDEEFYFILNLAIGGKFGGNVDDTCFPQKFIIKDIKIYK